MTKIPEHEDAGAESGGGPHPERAAPPRAGADTQALERYRLLIENSADMVSLHDPEGRWLYVSPACESLLGYAPEELIGTTGFPHIHHEDMAAIAALTEVLQREGGVRTLVSRAVRKDGTVIWVETAARIAHDDTGAPVHVHSITREISDRVDAEAKLRRSEAMYRSLVDNVPDTALVLLDRDLRVQMSHGGAVERLSWFSKELFVGKRVADLADIVPEETLHQSLTTYSAALAGEPGEFVVSSDGVELVIKAVPITDAAGDVDSVLVVARDVTESRATAERLESFARKQRAAARLGQMALRERDLDAVLRAAAETLAETLDVEYSAVLEFQEDLPGFRMRASRGWDVDRSIAHTPGSQAGYTIGVGDPVVVEDFESETRFRKAGVFDEHGVQSGLSVVIEGRDGPYGILAAHACRKRGYSSEDVNFLTTVANVLSAAIERHNDEEASRHAALHDPLTGLPNRVLALDRLEYGLARRRRDGSNVAVLVVDLDRFKLINDSLGHEAGDELLLALAPRLVAAVRAEDTVARLGGDEFAVICPGLHRLRDVITIAEKLAAATARPFALRNSERFVTASIGIATATSTADTPEDLLRDADIAMYRAKTGGRARYEVFDDAMRARTLERLRTETELRSALGNEELRLHYQPIVDTATERVTAVEALVRWEHPELGLRAPDEFIPIAEETGLIVELGEWVLEHACRQVAEWQRRLGPVRLSVNVSGRQLAEPLFGATASEIARASGLAPRSLTIEVTESTLISEAESPRDSLDVLRRHGLQLWLDDFGTGYSSLGYLKRFALDGIKIDRTFVDGLGEDPEDGAIVEAIVRMSQALELDVVAEGVETRDQLYRLNELGCVRAQGYLFSRPQAPAALEEYLDRHLVSASGGERT